MPPDIEQACRIAYEVLAVVEQPATASVPSERHTHVLAGLAATARCRALLRAIVRLVEVGRADTVGIEVRALLEMWYFGIISLLGDSADLERFEGDYRYWKNDLAKKIGQPAEPGAEAAFTVWQRAQRADVLLTEVGEQQGTAVTLYRQLFSGESLLNAHAGFQSVSRYSFERADGTVGVVLEPAVDHGYLYGQLRLAAVLTALLAKWTYEHAGLDASPFDDIGGLSAV